jgi:hypothetical protein
MSRVDQLAESLFIKFQKEFPPSGAKASGSRTNLSNKDIEQKLTRFYADARDERKKHRLWIINWARVVLKLQQRLLDAGYSSEMVSRLLLALLFTSYNAD